MLALVNQAMLFGYTAKQILNFVSNKIPSMKAGLQAARNSGFDEEKILKFLINKIPHNKEAVAEQETENDRYLKNIGIKTKKEREATRNKFLQGALGVGSGALAAYGLAKAIPSAISSLSNMPQTAQAAGQTAAGSVGAATSPPQVATSPVQGVVGQIPAAPAGGLQLPSGSQTNQVQNIVVPQSSQPPVSPSNITQQNTIEQYQGITNPKEFLEKKGVLDQVDDSLKRGNNPLQVATELGIKKTGRARVDQELLSNIEAYAKEAKAEPQEQKMLEPEGEKLDVSKEELEVEPEETKPIEKGSTIATKSGIGTVQSISGNNALVEENGKVKQVKIDDMIQSPLPEKDLADLYDDLIKGIEKHTGKQVSRNVEWSGYDPNTNELAYKPHGSDRLYVYDDIGKEDVEILTNFLTKRKSTGDSFIGAWEAGTESPIGAAMYQLIKRLQAERGGKGKEYSGKFETIYDAIEPARIEKKKKYQEKKKSEKAKKPKFG